YQLDQIGKSDFGIQGGTKHRWWLAVSKWMKASRRIGLRSSGPTRSLFRRLYIQHRLTRYHLLLGNSPLPLPMVSALHARQGRLQGNTTDRRLYHYSSSICSGVT